jgi:hypothetical protein
MEGKIIGGIFYNHGWHGLTRMGKLGYWQSRVREDWGVPTHRLLEWHGLSREAGLAEKNRNSRKLACRRFVVSPPHSPGECIQSPLYR